METFLLILGLSTMAYAQTIPDGPERACLTNLLQNNMALSSCLTEGQNITQEQYASYCTRCQTIIVPAFTQCNLTEQVSATQQLCSSQTAFPTFATPPIPSQEVQQCLLQASLDDPSVNTACSIQPSSLCSGECLAKSLTVYRSCGYTEGISYLQQLCNITSGGTTMSTEGATDDAIMNAAQLLAVITSAAIAMVLY